MPQMFLSPTIPLLCGIIKNIKQFNNDQYQKNIQKHWDALGSYESGHACETVANYILTSNT